MIHKSLLIQFLIFTKESLKAQTASSASSAEQISALQKSIEQERESHEMEIKALKSELERTTPKIQELESTLKRYQATNHYGLLGYRHMNLCKSDRFHCVFQIIADST